MAPKSVRGAVSRPGRSSLVQTAVIEPIDMPPGSLAFRASGRLTRDEYQDELMRPILAALDRGESINLLFETAPDFRGLDVGALWEDVKAAGTVGLAQRSRWRRMALVTDKDWVRHGASVFGWLAPGELRLFDLSERDKARAWMAETSHT